MSAEEHAEEPPPLPPVYPPDEEYVHLHVDFASHWDLSVYVHVSPLLPPEL